MGVRNWGVVAWLGLAACGGGPEEEAVSTALEALDSREVEALACPAGVASRVKVVLPPEAHPFSSMNGLTDVQGTLYFATHRPDTGPALWRSNGTQAGTVPVRTFPLEYDGPSAPVAVGSRLFFHVYAPDTGTELWLSDGTASGTRLVEDITPGPDSSSLTNAAEVNGRLVFFRHLPEAPTELWRSDGTAAGTLRVRVVSGAEGVYFGGTAKVGNALLFFRREASGLHLWRTDGMLAGTVSVKQVGGTSVALGQVTQAGNLGLFIIRNGVNHQVWKTDGTAAGTVLLDAFGRSVNILGVLGSRVYLASVEPNSRQMRIQSLLLSGGGKASVATLPKYSADASPYLGNTATSAGSIYFAVGQGGDGPAPLAVELWATDGTAGGTRKLFQSLSRHDEYASPVFATGGGLVLFSGSPDGDYLDGWFTRGTVATTGRFAATGPGTPLSWPDDFARVGNRVYFSAFDDTERQQLWSLPASFTCPPGLSEAR
ncbi:hypothetical protein [Corallococcus carmarthensis]|uniref:Hyalin n=1 Tax=Corallococcus carmarthensis TaxID=2316728 RepID=A0A3A8K9A4_9BACT|nr:hypothetical protein [Corallococcus carmarthensis]RKH03779.1 hypothetical protein D7X32_12875 [Corallococcus carmarthensis]